MIVSDPLLQALAAVLLLVLVPSAVHLIQPLRRDLLIAASAAGVFAGSVVLMLDAALTQRADPPAALLDAAAVATVTFVVTAVAAYRGVGSPASVSTPYLALHTGFWGALAVGPVLAATVATAPALVQRTLGAVDATGTLALFTAPAAALLTVSLLRPPAHRRAHVDPQSSTPEPSVAGSGGRSVIAVLLLTVAGVVWMVGIERVVSEATGRLAVNAAAGMILGVVTWLVVSRIVGRGRPRGGVVIGAALGWAAVGAGGAFLAPVALAAAGIVGAAAGTAIALRVPAGASPIRRAAVGVIVATAIGGLVATVLADGFGLAASGATLGLLTQLVAVVLVVVFSAVAALASWSAVWVVAAVVRAFARRSSGRASRSA